MQFLSAGELAERGLLPGGSRYTPNRTPADAAHLARMLHRAGLSLRTLASRLSAEGFCPPRVGKWFATTVAKLIERTEPSTAGVDEDNASSP